MKTSVLVLTAALAFLAADPAPAADLLLSPANIVMKVPTGESASSAIAGILNIPPAVPYSMTVLLRSVGGSLPSPWLVAQPTSFANRTPPLVLPFLVKIPPTAAPGTYTALVQPMVLNSSIPVLPPSRPVQVAVIVVGKCPAAPTVAIASAQPAEFKAPNGRLADVEIAGGVVVPPGCTPGRVWYTLVDEYGIFGETKDVTAAPDGSFAFTTPVQVSRRGEDKDGRLYQFTVYAADEAGTGSSAPAAVVVRHDQRKEK